MRKTTSTREDDVRTELERELATFCPWPGFPQELANRILYYFEVRPRFEEKNVFKTLNHSERERLASAEIWSEQDLLGVRVEHLMAMGFSLGRAAYIVEKSAEARGEKSLSDQIGQLTAVLERILQLASTEEG